MKLLKDWTLFEKIWLVLFLGVNIYLFIAWQDSLIGLIASISGMLCVVLVAKGKISNYYFGIIQTGTYAYIAFTYGLYGEVMLNGLFYFPVQFIGIYLWSKNKTKNSKLGEDIVVNKLSKKGWAIVVISLVGGISLYGLFLKYIGGNSVWIDSSTTILSVVAQIMMLKRFVEQWLLWILVNILSITMWLTVLITTGGNDFSMLVMWSAFLVNSIYGFYNWNKLYRK